MEAGGGQMLSKIRVKPVWSHDAHSRELPTGGCTQLPRLPGGAASRSFPTYKATVSIELPPPFLEGDSNDAQQ